MSRPLERRLVTALLVVLVSLAGCRVLSPDDGDALEVVAPCPVCGSEALPCSENCSGPGPVMGPHATEDTHARGGLESR